MSERLHINMCGHRGIFIIAHRSSKVNGNKYEDFCEGVVFKNPSSKIVFNVYKQEIT